MLPQQYCLRWKYHHSNLQTMFSQLLDRGCFCDVTLACEGQLIRAHRVVLCACSTFFDTVLTNYASERDPIIIMKDVTFADVKSLIEFMYKGEINVEHANLASLLKTADDLKIKGLAEVSWRDDEDNGSIGSVVPPPVPDTEFIIHSPPLPPSHHRTHDGYSAAAATLDSRCSPIDGDMDRRNSSPNQVHNKQQHHLPSRLPMLTPIPPPSITIAAASGDHYLGPRRKRGRPPLDDAYDVFNVHKLTQLGGQLDSQRYLDESRIHSAKNDEQQRRHLTSAYQQHIHQQQRRQRQKLEQQQHATDSEDADDTQTDPEWITSNLEVNVSECDVETIGPLENSDESQSVEQREKKIEKERMTKSPNSTREKTSTEEKLDTEKSSPKIERFNKKRSLLEKAKEHRQRENNEKQTTQSGDEEKMRRNSDQEENDEEPTVLPQPVEEIESVQQVLQQQQQQQISSSSVTATTTTPATIASPSDLPSTSSSSSSSHNDSQTKSINNTSHSNTHSHGAHHTTTHIPPPPPPAAHTHFTKYAPPEGGGYVLNEHGMLMTHDFPSHPVIGASNGNGDHEFIDIKMEDYDAADLRLTSEEMSQWQDVIKMDDYLAKGRRPQFWEEPFTRRVLDAIKNKRLEMKKAARILGVSYGTLYGRYREVYGCLKHPYSSTFRPSQSSQLAAVQPRFDIVWPSPKRDSGILPPPLEIGKIRPKDLSELWARPQI